MSSHQAPVPFEGLPSADLNLGRIYRGGGQVGVGADPLHKLTGVGNSGGFRKRNVKGSTMPALCVLFSTNAVSEWPDRWTADDTYLYYGDQRTANKDLLDTPRGGNQFLAEVDASLRRDRRDLVSPFFLFEKAGSGRDVRFEGLLVPASFDWLTVHHRETPEGTLSNYGAALRRLPEDLVSRHWLTQLQNGDPHGTAAPAAWLRWITTGEFD